MTITRVISTLAVDLTFVDAGDVTAIDNELLALINNMQNGIDAFEQLKMTAIVTPTAPGAGDFKLYPKSDGYFYTLDSSLVELQITGIDIVRYLVFT